MTTHLHIGPESDKNYSSPKKEALSEHLLSVKSADDVKRHKAHKEVSLNLKDEIKSKIENTPGRICIVGESSAEKQGLGRLPMIAGALMIILFLNLGQVIFLGQSRGNEALVLAGEAFSSLKDASESVISGEEGADMLLFTDAELLFKEAELKGKFLLKHESNWLLEPRPVQSLRGLIDAGELMAEVGLHLAEAQSAASNLPEEGSLTDYIRSISESQIEPAAQKLDEVNSLLDKVDLSGTEYYADFFSFREKIYALENLLDLWITAKDPLLTLLGDRYPQSYMILLMNNDEMRIGGGFIGSFLLVDLNDGRLENMEFHDVYDFDNRYYEQLEVPVHELEHLTANWRLRDSNVYANFPQTAKQAMWFLEEEGGRGVDGVIAVNLSSSQAILEDLGSISIPSLQKELTAETLPMVLSTLVEAKVYGQSSPKAVLGEIIESLVTSLDDQTKAMQMGFTLYDEAKKKQVMAYHKDPQVQDFISSLSLDATLPKLSEVEGDFFMPVFTNMGANKSDRYMETELKHETHIFDDGTIANSVSLKRTHTFTEGTLGWLKSTLADYGFLEWNEHLEKVMGNAANRTGIRLYLPENSVILDTHGILQDEIQFFYDKANDISYYFVDQTVLQGETKSFTIIYGLPWTLDKNFDEYTFRMFKQPGLKSVRMEKTVNAPDDTMLSSIPLSTENREGIDYVLNGPFHNDIQVKLLYR